MSLHKAQQNRKEELYDGTFIVCYLLTIHHECETALISFPATDYKLLLASLMLACSNLYSEMKKLIIASEKGKKVGS